MLHKDKVAIVTGGASGIGRATALAFAREGAKVVIADTNVADGERIAGEMRASGAAAIFVRTDVTQSADVQNMVNTAVSTYGGLDIAFNNAGTSGANGTVASLDEAEFHRTMAINVTSVYLCMKYEIPHMVARGGGAVVNTSSGMGLFALPNVAGYIASKHAVLGLTKSAALDFGPHKVRVNALCPGKTMTPMMLSQADALKIRLEDIAARVPLRALAEPEDQAEAVVWICSERAKFITGLSLIVDGGEAVVR
jgi:NAD(P)-dependent dehydrogenase (short-subunit alcohol dehydrogenase family)